MPFGRRGRREEIARAGVFLASDDAGFVTGQTLHVNGGSYLGCPKSESVSSVMTAAAPALAGLTALDRYVAAPHPSYRYETIGTLRSNGYTAQVMELTSQR